MKIDKTPFLLIMREEIQKMARWLRTVTLAYNPEIITFGGSVGIHFWALWKDEIQSELHSILRPLPYAPVITIDKTPNAGAFGAALLAQKPSPRLT